MALARQQDMYLTGRAVLDCGESTAAEIDKVVAKMLDKAYAQAKEILSGNLAALDKISAYLIEKETISGREFMEILNEVNNPRKEETHEEA